jgi:hypothetical protein
LITPRLRGDHTYNVHPVQRANPPFQTTMYAGAARQLGSKLTLRWRVPCCQVHGCVRRTLESDPVVSATSHVHTRSNRLLQEPGWAFEPLADTCDFKILDHQLQRALPLDFCAGAGLSVAYVRTVHSARRGSKCPSPQNASAHAAAHCPGRAPPAGRQRWPLLHL